MSRRTAALVVLPALAVSLLAAPAQAGAATGPDRTWVVSVDGALAPVLADLRRQGVTVERALQGVGTAVVSGPADLDRRLAGDPRVRSTSPDSGVRVLADAFDAKADPTSTYNVSQVIGARAMWVHGKKAGWTGKGVDVALLDTGVSPVPGLDGPGKLVHGPDLSFDSQDAGTRYVDGYGHGTHLAGIIAGRDADADPSRTGQAGPFQGMAPDARIVSVKVADAAGNADVSQIIAGIDWVVQHRRSGGLDIRVLNLSLGTPATQAAVVDPLAHAAEQAWHQGIVVVVAAGNDGTGTGQLLNPARNPYVIAVGANDSKGTISTDDDVVPSFSTRGDGVRNPDLVAPGRSLVSLRVPGSTIDAQHGAAAGVGTRFLRGSGTSQSAAVVSGAVALLLQQHPEYTPGDVKHLLMSGARRLPSADVQAQGSGMLDLRKPAAAGTLAYATQSFPRARGTGSLDEARGGLVVQDELGQDLTGERDVFGQTWDGKAHAAQSAAGTAWTGGSWNGSVWTGSDWAAQGWRATAWTGVDWTGRAWAGRAWAGRAWAGRAWAGRAWASGGWG